MSGTKLSVGIDYSMSCPAACAYQPDNVTFWYAHATKSATFANVQHADIPDEATVKRAGTMAWSLIEWLLDYHVDTVSMEDYAFSATGRVFHIGEHGGILKYVLQQNMIAVNVVPPTVIKKFATGKGNADKEQMTSAFLKEYDTAESWVTHFFPRYKEGSSVAKSPLADLADAYWLAKYAYSL